VAVLPDQPPKLVSEGHIFCGQLPFTERPQAIDEELAPLSSTVTLQSKLAPLANGGWGLVSIPVTAIQLEAAWERRSCGSCEILFRSAIPRTITVMDMRAKRVISPDSFFRNLAIQMVQQI